MWWNLLLLFICFGYYKSISITDDQWTSVAAVCSHSSQSHVRNMFEIHKRCIQIQVYGSNIWLCPNRQMNVSEMKYIIFNHSYRIVSYHLIQSFLHLLHIHTHTHTRHTACVRYSHCSWRQTGNESTVDRCQGNTKLWSAYSMFTLNTHTMNIHRLIYCMILNML